MQQEHQYDYPWNLLLWEPPHQAFTLRDISLLFSGGPSDPRQMYFTFCRLKQAKKHTIDDVLFRLFVYL
jgi:hypothetical protein